MDTRLLPLPDVTAFAPPAPVSRQARDGKLVVLVVDGRGCRPTQPAPSGASAGGRDAGAAGAGPASASDAGAVATAQPRGADCSEAPPVSDAQVRLYLRLGDRYYAAGAGATDGAGKLALDELPRGVTWVLVEAPGYARSSAQILVEGDEAPESVRLARVVLEPAQALTVGVQDEAGEPVSEATVLATGGDPLPHGGITDAHGSVRFDRLGRAPWTVKASARGYESVTQSGVTSALTLTLRRLGSLSVKVIGVDGGPAARANVQISGSGLWPARRAETDAMGITRIGGLLSGSYDVRAELGNAVSHTVLGHQVTRGEHTELTLQLLPGRMVRVLVVGGAEEDAAAVPGADVVLTEFGLSSFPLQGQTGSDGAVALGPIAPGPAAVSARAAGFVARGGVAVPETLDGPVRVILLKGATLLGLVTDSAGNTVDGASIEVVGTDVDGMPVAETPQLTAFRDAHFSWALAGPSPLIPAGELGVMPGPIPPIPKDWSAVAEAIAAGGIQAGTADPARASDYIPWVTGLDGRFTARPVTPGRLRAIVRHPAYVEGISDVVVLAPGGQAEVEVVLKAGGTLEGKVVDSAGYGVSGARVDIVALEGSLERTTVTASDGSFAFAAVPEQILLNVYRPEDFDRVAVKKVLEVPEGKRKEIEITLPERRDAVIIYVENPDGAAVALAQVTVLSLDPDQPLRATYFTSERGEVEVEDARGLPLQVIVVAPGFARAEQQIKSAGERLELELELAVTVSGQVTAVRGRQFVEGATVVVIGAGEQRSGRTDAEGSYSIEGATPGAVRVVVSHPDYARVERSVVVERTSRDRPFVLPSIDLSAPATLEGEVVDPRGDPVAGARVALDIAPAFLPAGPLPAGVALSDARGHFVLRGVGAGDLVVEAYSADVGRGRARIKVSEGDTARGLKIVLSEPVGDAEPAASGSLAVTLGERDFEDEVVVVLIQVTAGSEAERAGLLRGDFVLAVDGVAVNSMTAARTRMSGPVRGDVVLLIERAGAQRSLRVRREQVRR